MNVDRGKESFSDQEVQDLRARVQAFKTQVDLSWDKLGKRMGIAPGTLSTWATNNYGGDNSRVAYEVNKFFLADEARQAMELEAPIRPDFQSTPTARKIHAQLRWAQRGKISVMTGESGVGKTHAIVQYATVTNNVFVATMSEGTVSPTSMLVELLRSMGADGYRSGGMGGVQALSYDIIERVAGRRALLVFDEAQYLSDRALNQLRFIHDKCAVGVALSGNLDIMGRINRGGRGGPAPFAQLHSRVSMPAHYAKPDPADVEMLLNAWEVRAPQQRAFLSKVADQPGCLRQVGEILEAATLVARQSDEPVALSHLQAAYAQRNAKPIAA